MFTARRITGIVMILSLLLAACGSKTPEPTATQSIPPTDTPLPPTSAPTRIPSTSTPLPPTLTPTLYVRPPNAATALPISPSALPPAPAEGQPGLVANFNTWLFSGPGSDYFALGALMEGESAQLAGVSDNGRWFAINLPLMGNGLAWVEYSYVHLVNVPDPLPIIAAPPIPPQVTILAPAETEAQATVLVQTAVRQGPGEEYPLYGTAQLGTASKVLGKSEDGDYWLIRIDPKLAGVGNGWVNAQYVDTKNTLDITVAQASQLPPAVEFSIPPSGAAEFTAFDTLNVYGGPGLQYPVLGIGAPGETGEVSGKSNDGKWWQVKVPVSVSENGFAWVAAAYVQAKSVADVPVVEAPAPPDVGDVTTPSTDVLCVLTYQDPLDYTLLSPGTTVTVTWVLLNTGNTPWDASTVSLKNLKSSPSKLHKGADSYKLANTIAPGESYTVQIGMTVANKTGIQGESWGFVEGKVILCPFWVFFEVK